MRSMLLAAAAACFTLAPAMRADAQSEPFLGQIMYVAFDYCPRGWLPAEGQTLPIQRNQSLFALFGTIYGGDGRTDFALPDLRGRVTVSSDGFGGAYRIGTTGGANSVALSEAQMPRHAHRNLARATDAAGNADSPEGARLASRGGKRYARDAAADATMADGSVETLDTGGGQPVDVRQPYVALRACIATQGHWPSRN